METDRTFIDYESRIRPSEYYTERRSNSNLVTRKDVNRLLKSCRVDKDPLVHWIKYIAYVKERYPFEEETIWRINHRCVCTLVYHDQYKFDQRFVRICVIYADHCQDSLKRFQYLYKMEVGLSMAMMWMSWAWVAEKRGDYSLARNIFRKALERKAKPMNVVQERFKTFLRRMKRRDEELSALNDTEVNEIDLSKSSKGAERPSENSKNTTSARKSQNKLSAQDRQQTKQESQSLEMDSISRQASKRQKVSLQCDSNTFRDVSNNKFDESSDTKKQYPKVKQKCQLLGFKRILVARDDFGIETCFERERARMGGYSQCNTENFNTLLHQDGLDYNIRHHQDTENAIKVLTSRQWHESTIGAVHWQFDQQLPRCLAKPTKRGGSFALDGFEYNVLHKLGSGAYGTVFLCEPKNHDKQNDEEEKFALKVQIPVGCLAWEFKVLEKLKARADDNDMFPEASSINFFSDGGAIQMTAGSESGFNLLDVVNLYKGNVPELIAIYYTHRMLCTLEELHLHRKFLHADVKPDNWIVRHDPDNISDLMLIDFGRAIELTDDTIQKGFRGRVAADDLECVAMRNEQRWCFDIDCFGLCVCSHTLLFGTYMELVQTKGKKWILKEPLRRYWQTPLWRLLFDSFINAKAHDLRSYTKTLSGIKQAFEMHLAFKSRELNQILLNLNTLLPSRKI